MADEELRNVVALVDGDRVLSFDGRRGLSTLPETEPWPDLDQIAEAGGVATVLPIGPARRLTDLHAAVHVVAGPGPSSLDETSWAPLDALARRGVPAAVADVITSTVGEHHGSLPWPAQRPVWFRDGWLAEADRWIDERVAHAGWQRTGPTVPARLWSLSAVLRAPVDGPAGPTSVWFKATCDWFRGEAAITEVLGTFAAAHVPRLLAVDRERAWMLMEELPGPDLNGRSELAPLVATATAATQIAAIDHVPSLAAAGCPDRSLQPTLDAFHQLVHGSVEIGRLRPDEQAAAVAIEPSVGDRIAALFATGLPSTLAHGDCHLGNVAVDGERAVLYDWTDACVSHPFLDGVHLARSAGDDHRDAVKAAFIAPWRDAYPGADVDRAWELATFGNRVFQAISYEGIYRAQEEASRWEMSGIVAGTLRELIAEFGQKSE